MTITCYSSTYFAHCFKTVATARDGLFEWISKGKVAECDETERKTHINSKEGNYSGQSILFFLKDDGFLYLVNESLYIIRCSLPRLHSLSM